MDGFDCLAPCSPDSLPQDLRALDSKNTVIIRMGVGIHLLILLVFVVVVGGPHFCRLYFSILGVQTFEEVVRKLTYCRHRSSSLSLTVGTGASTRLSELSSNRAAVGKGEVVFALL